MSMFTSREDLLHLATLANRTARYGDMKSHIKDLIVNCNTATVTDLSLDERNLFSIAYKNLAAKKRDAWRILSTIGQRASTGELNKIEQTTAKSFCKQIEMELKDLCNEVVGLIETYLILNADNESKVFYNKMKGDYYRYLAEFSIQDERKVYAEHALKAYKQASEIAVQSLKPTSPLRLGLVLNFSVFFYEILDSVDRACQLTRAALDDAIAELDSLDECDYKDATLILQLLRDNLRLWSTTSPIRRRI